ncbi:MAG: DUF448 domain-containing protein [Sphingomonadaceae bacterium]
MRTPNNERLSSGIADTGASLRGAPSNASGKKPSGKNAVAERRCILLGSHGPRDTLVRLAVSPDGLVLPDVMGKAPGRGAWLGVSRAELEQAMASGKFRAALARAFRGGGLEWPDDLAERLENALKRQFMDRLGLEMRAGHIILGSDRIAEQARTGRVALLLHAADASDDGSRRLDQAWRVGREIEGSGEKGVRLPLDRMALSVALGRSNVVHMALTDPAAADRVRLSLERLVHFCGADAPLTDPVAKEQGMLPKATCDDDDLSVEG